jgi:hypothetical protein
VCKSWFRQTSKSTAFETEQISKARRIHPALDESASIPSVIGD